MIWPQSRYQQGTVARVQTAAATSSTTQDVYQVTVFRTVPTAIAPFVLYVWKETDRPDIVAQRFLGNPQLWWTIFDLNPGVINPLTVPAGTVMRIPSAPQQGQGTLLQ